MGIKKIFAKVSSGKITHFKFADGAVIHAQQKVERGETKGRTEVTTKREKGSSQWMNRNKRNNHIILKKKIL